MTDFCRPTLSREKNRSCFRLLISEQVNKTKDNHRQTITIISVCCCWYVNVSTIFRRQRVEFISWNYETRASTENNIGVVQCAYDVVLPRGKAVSPSHSRSTVMTWRRAWSRSKWYAPYGRPRMLAPCGRSDDSHFPFVQHTAIFADNKYNGKHGLTEAI